MGEHMQRVNAVVGTLVVADELSEATQAAQEDEELCRREALRQKSREDLERAVAEQTAQLRAANAALEAEIDERRRHQRAWRTLSECNKGMVRAADEEALFRDVCRILVDVGGYRMSWVGLAERDGTIRPVAHAGHEDGYLSEIGFAWAESDERSRGPVGVAVRTGRPLVARDLSQVLEFAPWRERAARRGYVSIVALPLLSEGRTFGALAIYAADPRALDEDEIALLSDLATDLAFGVTALRVRAERSRMTAQLMQADRLAAMGTLAAGVGHEINNPLSYVMSGVQGLAELVREEFSDAERCSKAQAILREVSQGLERIRQAVRDLKLFSRGDDSRRPVEIQSVLESTLHMAHNDIRHRAQLVRQYGPTPVVAANESRLGQVFLNLVVNASQSIPDGNAEANEIRVVTRTDERGWAAIEIRDTGAGISPEDLPRIFDPFFTTKPPGEGTGLGLAICRSIVDSMGGEIGVESERGRGSLFRVTLPPMEAGSARPAAPVGARAAARRSRLLIVDDDLLVARSIHRMLAREHEAIVETSSRAALDRVRAGERFDVILCDVMMPQMSGPEFHAQLRHAAPDQAARVVFVTGGVFTASTAAYLEQFGCRKLEKPFEAEALRALVAEVTET